MSRTEGGTFIHPYRLPIKFILLWIANLAVLVILGIVLESPMPGSIQNAAACYLLLGGVLAGLEQALFHKLRGE